MEWKFESLARTPDFHEFLVLWHESAEKTLVEAQKIAASTPSKPPEQSFAAREHIGIYHALVPTVNREGRETAVAVVRATFELNEANRLQPAHEQVDVRLEGRLFRRSRCFHFVRNPILPLQAGH